MRLAYSSLFYLLIPYLLIRLWWKSLKFAAYRKHILERFALNKNPSTSVDIWIHTVSLGEVITAEYLIDILLKKNYKILLTTMTPTARKRIQQHYGNTIRYQYIPYDAPFIVKRFYKKIKPKTAIFFETEIWPNLIYYSKIFKINLLLINARLSEHSYKNYKKFKSLFKPILQNFDRILVQSDEDAKRYHNLGASEKQLAVIGNLKFAIQLKNINVDLNFLENFKNKLGTHRIVLIFASTHHNEEELILSRLKQLQISIPNLLLLIAPRHPERFQAVYKVSSVKYGFNTGLRSQFDALSYNNEVVILDCTGELLQFYKLSDYAFVGGSLVACGGHNVLEPIAMQTPVFIGPYTYNFKEICHKLHTTQSIISIKNIDDFILQFLNLQNCKQKKQDLIQNASNVLQTHNAIIGNYLAMIEAFI